MSGPLCPVVAPPPGGHPAAALALLLSRFRAPSRPTRIPRGERDPAPPGREAARSGGAGTGGGRAGGEQGSGSVNASGDPHVPGEQLRDQAVALPRR